MRKRAWKEARGLRGYGAEVGRVRRSGGWLSQSERILKLFY